jgi:hypothetical protein
MKRVTVALGAIIATLSMIFLMSAPAQASVLIGGRYWSAVDCKSDSAGTGTLKICFRYEVGAKGEQTDGFYIESYTISAASGGAAYQGIGGHGGSMWTCTTCSPFWSIDSNQSSLNPGQFKSWDLEIAKPGADRLAGGWHYEDIFIPGGNQNQCAKIIVYHNGNTDKGGC